MTTMTTPVDVGDQLDHARSSREARERERLLCSQSIMVRFNVSTFGDGPIRVPGIESVAVGQVLDKARIATSQAYLVPNELRAQARKYRQIIHGAYNRGTIRLGDGTRIVPLGRESRKWHEEEAAARAAADAVADGLCTESNLAAIHRYNRDYWVPVLQNVEPAVAETTYDNWIGWALPTTVEQMRGRFRVNVVVLDSPSLSDTLDVMDFAVQFVEAGIHARLEEADEVADAVVRELTDRVVDVMDQLKDQLRNGKVVRPDTFTAIRAELDKLMYAGKALSPEVTDLARLAQQRIKAGVDLSGIGGESFTESIKRRSGDIVAALDALGGKLKTAIDVEQIREQYGFVPRRITVRPVKS